jgi:hypothetical protein
MKMPKKANDMLIVIAAEKAAKDLDKSPKKIDKEIEMEDSKEYCCPKCQFCGSESDFEE